MNENNKRVSFDRKSLDAAILRKKSSDDSINSQKNPSSPVSSHMSLAYKKKKILYSEDSNDSDFEYY